MGRTKVNSVLSFVSISLLLGRAFGLYDRTSLDNDQCSAALEDQEVHDFRFLGPSELQPEVFTDDGVGHFSEIQGSRKRPERHLLEGTEPNMTRHFLERP